MNAHVVRSGMLAAAALCLLTPTFASSPQGQQKTALVTVVAEASGPMRDLTAKDFIVTEDGQKREVVSAALAEEPLSIALLVDSTQPQPGAMPPTQDLRNALAAFVKAVQSQSPGAQIALSEFGGASVPRVPFGGKPGDLEAAIGRLYPNQQVHAVLLEALVDAGKLLAGQPAPRRAIVSVDFNSREGSAERSMKAAAEAVHNAGATLWTVSVRGSVVSTPIREEVLNKIIQANGGLRLMPVDASGLEANLKIIAHSLASQYTVSFMRTGGNPKTTTFETTRGAKVQKTPWMR
ncbi:MAG TPA: hypothetical protein VFK57_22035 [Vicinamibacterales bacterium]|nr:hypothetical protein [Vicinamibacterales bacterium]